MKKITSLFMVLIISGMGMFAQTKKEVTDNELKKFASASQQVEVINQQTEKNMVKAVEKEGLEVQRYNEIQQAQQVSNQEAGTSDEEIKKYESASMELQKIQKQAQQKMQKKITEEGLTVSRYQEISEAIQTNPDLQQKLQEYLKG